MLLRPTTQVYKIDSYENSKAILQIVSQALESHLMLAGWTPHPDRHIVIKPNWVQESHEYKPDEWECVITHPSVLLAVITAAAQWMQGQGTISLCDAPHTYANFSAILNRGHLDSSLESIRSRWPNLNLELIDLRREIWLRKEEVIVSRVPNEPDPRGYVALNLGKRSLFYNHPGEGKYYGADYDVSAVRSHHQGEIQEYLLAGTPIACDLFINVAKLKTHKKTGITCCLKNLVGINGDKNWLPHHTQGSPRQGGDEYPDTTPSQQLESSLKSFGQKLALRFPGLGTWLFRKMRRAGKAMLGDSETTIRNGNWYGNNTCWRMALDLNRCLLFGNPDGSWRSSNQPKPYLGIIDGIVAGEGNGPICPDPVNANVLITGTSPAVLDAVAAQLMGFEPQRISIVRESFAIDHPLPIADSTLDDIRVWDHREQDEIRLTELKPATPLRFRPHFGWADYLGGPADH
jgi:uncharacterized protein (DUF362 family)